MTVTDENYIYKQTNSRINYGSLLPLWNCM